MARLEHGKSVAFAYLGIALPGVAAVALYPYLVTNLGPERFGAFSLLMTIALFFGTFDFGVGLAVTRYSARLDGRVGARHGIRRLLRHAIAMQFVIGLAVGTALIITHFAFGVVSLPADSQLVAEVDLGVLFLGLSIPLALIAGVIRCALEGTGRYGVANALRAPSTICTFAVPIATSFFLPAIDSIVLSLFAVRVLTVVVFLSVWVRIAPLERSWQWQIHRLFSHAKVLMSYGGWVMVGVGAGGVIVLGVVDRVLVGKLLGVGALLNHSVPSDIIVRCLLIPSAISSVLLTALTRHIASSMRELKDPAAQGVALVAHQAGPVAAVLMLNSDWLTAFLTSQQASPAAAVILQGLAAGYFAHSLAHVPYCGMHAVGAPRAAGLRHLFELPLYALASTLALTAGYLSALGWIWAAWAVLDLLLLLAMHRLIAPSHRLLSAFAQPAPWLWAGVIFIALALASSGISSQLRVAASAALGLWFAWKVLHIWHNPALFRASET